MSRELADILVLAVAIAGLALGLTGVFWFCERVISRITRRRDNRGQ